MTRLHIAIPTACCLAVAAFLVAMIAGVLTGNAFSSILERAFIALLLAWPIGFAVGKILEWLVMENAMDSEVAVPEVPSSTGDGDSGLVGMELDEGPDESDGRGSAPLRNEAETAGTMPL